MLYLIELVQEQPPATACSPRKKRRAITAPADACMHCASLRFEPTPADPHRMICRRCAQAYTVIEGEMIKVKRDPEPGASRWGGGGLKLNVLTEDDPLDDLAGDDGVEYEVDPAQITLVFPRIERRRSILRDEVGLMMCLAIQLLGKAVRMIEEPAAWTLRRAWVPAFCLLFATVVGITYERSAQSRQYRDQVKAQLAAVEPRIMQAADESLEAMGCNIRIDEIEFDLPPLATQMPDPCRFTVWTGQTDQFRNVYASGLMESPFTGVYHHAQKAFTLNLKWRQLVMVGDFDITPGGYDGSAAVRHKGDRVATVAWRGDQRAIDGTIPKTNAFDQFTHGLENMAQRRQQEAERITGISRSAGSGGPNAAPNYDGLFDDIIISE